MQIEDKYRRTHIYFGGSKGYVNNGTSYPVTLPNNMKPIVTRTGPGCWSVTMTITFSSHQAVCMYKI